MPKSRNTRVAQKPIEQYEHTDKDRVNNPPVGLVDAHTDNGGQKKKTYEYDPHLDPQLQWAGKAEHTSFEVPTVSLHVHERIDPRKIIETVKKEGGNPTGREGALQQPSLFEQEKKPLREAIEFYKHKDAWSNRLIAGDSLLVMNSLLEKEGMAGKVQMVYFDPPYGIKYGSNFQPFVNKRDVKDGKDEDLTAEPEMIKAFRDTWELGIHSYLTYLRDRLLLAKELLHESGSIFVQISDENLHHVRELMDEVFEGKNFCGKVVFQKTGWKQSDLLSFVSDNLVWYAKDIEKIKYRQIWFSKLDSKSFAGQDIWKEDSVGNRTRLPKDFDFANLASGDKVFRHTSIKSAGQSDTGTFSFELNGKTFHPGAGQHWKTTREGLARLAKANRLLPFATSVEFVSYLDDFPYSPFTNMWTDTVSSGFSESRIYAVQTNTKVVERCTLMTTDPGDLVLDITCGSGTTAFVAENWGRRWITCDTSRVATALAKQRLMTADFDYFELAHPDEGVGSGFKYKTVPHITLKSIANNEPAPQETLYDQPFIDNKKLRITGPFTVEAVPSPNVRGPESSSSPPYEGGVASASDDGVVLSDDAENHPTAKAVPLLRKEGSLGADNSVARSGETLRQSEWIDRLKDGIRGKGGSKIEFSRVEMLSGTHYLQAEAETRAVASVPDDKPKRVVICFGPEHAPLEKRLVDLALTEAEHLRPAPQLILFCAFQFDPEARKYIDETVWKDVQLLEVQMDADLQTDDLKKKPRDKTNPGFWLIGQPDVDIRPAKNPVATAPGSDMLHEVEVRGFDYYNPKTGQVESGGKADIAMWMLDPDYDDRSLFPTQVFFPMAGDKEGWSKLAKNLKAEIDEEKIEAFRGTVSLPFKPGRKVAVKIIDARGIESLKIIHL